MGNNYNIDCAYGEEFKKKWDKARNELRFNYSGLDKIPITCVDAKVTRAANRK